MGNFTAKENKILLALVSDRIHYGFSESEALACIRARLGREISPQAYYNRKKQVDSDKYAK
jgi:hypothetical protein